MNVRTNIVKKAGLAITRNNIQMQLNWTEQTQCEWGTTPKINDHVAPSPEKESQRKHSKGLVLSSNLASSERHPMRWQRPRRRIVPDGDTVEIMASLTAADLDLPVMFSPLVTGPAAAIQIKSWIYCVFSVFIHRYSFHLLAVKLLNIYIIFVLVW